jgi:hypothetical protein
MEARELKLPRREFKLNTALVPVGAQRTPLG